MCNLIKNGSKGVVAVLSTFTINACLLFFSGCASIPRGQAVELALSGESATKASESLLLDLANDISQRSERELVQDALNDCLKGNTNKLHACTPAKITPSKSVSDKKNQQLSHIIMLQVQSIQSLSAAYKSIEIEAENHRRANLEDKLNILDTQVNELAAGLQSANVATPTLLSVKPLLDDIAGAVEDQAQTRRLKEGSKRIRRALEVLVQSMKADALLYEQISGPIVTNKSSIIDMLLANGLADSTSTFAAFESSLGVAPSKALLSSDPLTIVAARTIIAYKAQREVESVMQSYVENEHALESLIIQHRRFETGLQPEEDQLTASADHLKQSAPYLKP